MKRVLLILAILNLFLFAREAVIKEILSENMILIEQNGVTKRAQLAGIALFANVNYKNKKVSYKEREKLHAEAMDYLLEHMPIGSKIKYIKIDNAQKGPEYIWPVVNGDQELNYLMVKNGYALLDATNPYLLAMFEMRLKRAMKYAKQKRLGLWKENYATMSQLVEKRDYYGSTNKNVSKFEVLGFLESRAK